MTAHQSLNKPQLYTCDMTNLIVGCTTTRVKFGLVTIREVRVVGWIQACGAPCKKVRELAGKGRTY